MITITDRKGRLWARRIDTDAAVRMRDLAGFDVMAFAAGEADPLTDIETTVNALYALFLPDAGSITAWRFGRRLRRIPAGDLQRDLGEAIEEFFDLPGFEDREAGGEHNQPSGADLWKLLYRSAGEAGVRPGPHTLGELIRLAEGRRRDEWSRAAHLIAAQFNSMGGDADPAKLDPTGGLAESGGGSGHQRELTPDRLASFAAMFVP